LVPGEKSILLGELSVVHRERLVPGEVWHLRSILSQFKSENESPSTLGRTLQCLPLICEAMHQVIEIQFLTDI
jgi:hypothetical protein